jgi:Uma2 family endonuclease
MAVRLTRRRFSADEYQWMARVGILGEDDRLELIDGEIVEMAPIGPAHSSAVDEIAACFFRRFGDVARIRVQNPVRLDPYSEPQPDLALVRARADAYKTALPGPDDIYLLVEVADTSLAVDQRVKMPLYARAGIPEVWIVDLRHEVLYVHRDPSEATYRVTMPARRGQSLAPLAFPDCGLAVADLLG